MTRPLTALLLQSVGWGLAALLLLIPAAAMAIGVGGVLWTASDFLAAFVLLAGTGLLLTAIARLFPTPTMRAGAALALCSTLFVTWANLAVGIVGAADNPFNIVYFLLLPILVLGTYMARLQARGMVRLMWIVALAFIALGLAAVAGGAGPPVKVIASHGVFAALFAASGALFGRQDGR